MKTIATLDFLVVLGYALGIAILGSSFCRRRSTTRQYFLGDKSMSWMPVGFSIVAAGIFAVSLVMSQTRWSFLYLSPVGLSVTLLAGYATTFLTQPPSLEKVQGMVMGVAVAEQEVSGKLLMQREPLDR